MMTAHTNAQISTLQQQILDIQACMKTLPPQSIYWQKLCQIRNIKFEEISELKKNITLNTF